MKLSNEDLQFIELLKNIVAKYNHFRVNIKEFTVIMINNYDSYLLEPITDRQTLMTGFFGTYLGSKCYVSKEVAPGYIQLANVQDDNNKINWSMQFKLKTFDLQDVERMFDLKAFW